MEQETQSRVEIYDQGKGTPYERISLWDFFASFDKEKNPPKSFLEVPKDGMFGICGVNSLFLASRGRQSTLFYEDQDKADLVRKIAQIYRLEIGLKRYEGLGSLKKIPDHSQDFVWAFNILTDYRDWDEILREMARISRKYVFFTYMNKKNYGYFIHRLHHKKTRRRWEHADFDKKDLIRIDRIMAEAGFKLENKIPLDAPWFPDIGAPIGQVKADLLPFLFRGEKPAGRSGGGLSFEWDDLPYFDAKKLQDLRAMMKKDFRIEKKAPYPLKIFFAHHIGLLYQKGR